jgi:hypothetical protein
MLPALLLRTTLAFVGLLCTGIGVGSAYTFFFAFNPSHSAPSFWVARIQHSVIHAGVALFVVQPIGFACSVALAVLQRDREPAFAYLVVASAGMLIAALATRLGNIPINVEMRDWNPESLPAHHPARIRRWWRFHVARFVAMVVAFGSLILSAVN